MIAEEEVCTCTYSTCLDHSGGSLNVMNIQLVKIVHMMIMLNNVRRQVKESLNSVTDIYNNSNKATTKIKF